MASAARCRRASRSRSARRSARVSSRCGSSSRARGRAADTQIHSWDDKTWPESDTADVIRRSLRYVNELPEALQKQLALAYSAKDLLAYGLRARLREGYSIKDFRTDPLAALVGGG